MGIIYSAGQTILFAAESSLIYCVEMGFKNQVKEKLNGHAMKDTKVWYMYGKMRLLLYESMEGLMNQDMMR